MSIVDCTIKSSHLFLIHNLYARNGWGLEAARIRDVEHEYKRENLPKVGRPLQYARGHAAPRAEFASHLTKTRPAVWGAKWTH